MTPLQCRLARAALDWTAEDLAREAQVNVGTVRRFEGGKPALSTTIAKMKARMEAAGVVFIAPDTPSLTGGQGIRLRG